MNGGHLAAFLGSVAAAAYFVATPLLARRFAESTSPRGIAARLHSPEDRFTFRVRYATWDPGAPLGPRSGFVYGRGKATYRLGDDGLTHLSFVRSDGKLVERSGPVPPRRDVTGRNKALYGPVAVTAGCAVVGAVVGYLVAAATSSSGLEGAAWGLLVGVGVGWVAAMITGIVLGSRRVGTRGDK
jgi:hypothetical protein